MKNTDKLSSDQLELLIDKQKALEDIIKSGVSIGGEEFDGYLVLGKLLFEEKFNREVEEQIGDIGEVLYCYMYIFINAYFEEYGYPAQVKDKDELRELLLKYFYRLGNKKTENIFKDIDLMKSVVVKEPLYKVLNTIFLNIYKRELIEIFDTDLVKVDIKKYLDKKTIKKLSDSVYASEVVSEVNVLSGINIDPNNLLEAINNKNTDLEFTLDDKTKYINAITEIFYYFTKIESIEKYIATIAYALEGRGLILSNNDKVALKEIINKNINKNFFGVSNGFKTWFINLVLKFSDDDERREVFAFNEIKNIVVKGETVIDISDYFSGSSKLKNSLERYKKGDTGKELIEETFDSQYSKIDLEKTFEMDDPDKIVLTLKEKLPTDIFLPSILSSYFHLTTKSDSIDTKHRFLLQLLDSLVVGLDRAITKKELEKIVLLLSNPDYKIASTQILSVFKKILFGITNTELNIENDITKISVLYYLKALCLKELNNKENGSGNELRAKKRINTVIKLLRESMDKIDNIYGDISVLGKEKFCSLVDIYEVIAVNFYEFLVLTDLDCSYIATIFSDESLLFKTVLSKILYEKILAKSMIENKDDENMVVVFEYIKVIGSSLKRDQLDLLFQLAQLKDTDSYNMIVGQLITISQYRHKNFSKRREYIEKYQISLGMQNKQVRERQIQFLFNKKETIRSYIDTILTLVVNDREIVDGLLLCFIMNLEEYIISNDMDIGEDITNEFFEYIDYSYKYLTKIGGIDNSYDNYFEVIIDSIENVNIPIPYREHLIELLKERAKKFIFERKDTEIFLSGLEKHKEYFDFICKLYDLITITEKIFTKSSRTKEEFTDFFDAINRFFISMQSIDITIRDIIRINKSFFSCIVFFIQNKGYIQENMDNSVPHITDFFDTVSGISLYETVSLSMQNDLNIKFARMFQNNDGLRENIIRYLVAHPEHQFIKKIISYYNPFGIHNYSNSNIKGEIEDNICFLRREVFMDAGEEYQKVWFNALSASDYRIYYKSFAIINDLFETEKDNNYIEFFLHGLIKQVINNYDSYSDVMVFLNGLLVNLPMEYRSILQKTFRITLFSEEIINFLFQDNRNEKRYEIKDGWKDYSIMTRDISQTFINIENQINKNILLRRSEQIFDYIMSDNIELGEVGAEIKELEERIRYGKRRVLASGNMYKFRLKELKDNRLTEVFHTAYVSRGVIDLTPELMEERISGDYKQVSGKKSKSIYFVGAKKDEKGQYGNIVIQVVFERDGRYKITPCIREGNKFNRMKGCDYIKEGEVGEAERIIMENIYYLSLKVLERYYLSRTAEEIEAIKEERIYKKEASQRREEEEIREVKVEEEETKEELLKKMTVIRQVKAKEEFYAPVGEDIEQEERAGEEKRRILAKKVKCLKKLFKGKVFDRELAAKSILYVKEDLPKEYGDKLGISYTQMRTINEYPKGYIEIDPEHDRMALTQLEKIYKLQRYDDRILEYIYVQTVSPHITRLPYIFYSRRLGEGKSMYVSTQKRPTEESKEKYESFIEEYPEEELPLFNKEIRSNLVVKSYLPKRLEIEEGVFEGVDMNNVKEVKSGFMRLRERVRLQGEEVDKVSQYKMIDEVMKNLRLIEEMSSDRYEESLNKRKEELIRERARVFKSEELGAEDGISDIREKVMSKLTELIEARNLRRARIKKKDMEEANELLFEVIEKIEKDKRLEEVDIIVLEDIFKEAVIEDNVRDYKVDIERQSIIRAKLESIGKLSKVSDIFSVESREYILTRLYNEYERRESIMERGERLIEDEIPSYERFLSELINIEQIDIKISETEDMGIRRELIEARNKRVEELKYMELGNNEGLEIIDNKLKEIEYMLKTVRKQREERVFDIKRRQIYYVLPDFPTYITFNRGNIIPVKKFLE